jgi:hypothetical protein
VRRLIFSHKKKEKDIWYINSIKTDKILNFFYL